MSKQLALSSAFAIFALSALALLGPGAARVGDIFEAGAAMEIAAPALLPVLPPALPPVLPDVPALVSVSVD